MHNTTFLQVYLNKHFSIQLLQGSTFVEGKIPVRILASNRKVSLLSGMEL